MQETEIFLCWFSRAFLAKKTKDLSGGWRMRVALGRALLSQVGLQTNKSFWPTTFFGYKCHKFFSCLVVLQIVQQFRNF